MPRPSGSTILQQGVQVVYYASQGWTYDRIGTQLGITENAARKRAHRTFPRLGAKSMPHAVAICYQNNLFPAVNNNA